MRHLVRRTCAVVLAAGTVLAVSACEGSDSATGDTVVTVTPTDPTATDAPAEATTTVAAPVVTDAAVDTEPATTTVETVLATPDTVADTTVAPDTTAVPTTTAAPQPTAAAVPAITEDELAKLEQTLDDIDHVLGQLDADLAQD